MLRRKINLKNKSMKIEKSSLLMALVITLFASCSSSEEKSAELKSLQGIWNVKTIRGGIAGIDDDYTTGTITWAFTDHTFTVDNNDSDASAYTGLESGTYSYATTQINGLNYISINGTGYGSYILSNNNLTINQNETVSGPASDGFILGFER